jgi:methionine-rich copper-binding protein CopC
MYVWIVGSGNRYFTSQNVKIDGVTSDVSLPLALQNFSVKLSNNNALLSWNTSNELSMKEFVVEKSTDGIRFKNVGIVLAKNEVNNQYEFVDAEKMIAKTYYRLKMINQDGSYKYSHIVLLQSNIIQKGISVYPNPASNSITISHAVSSKKSTIKIVNAQGKLVQIVFVAANTSNTTILVQQLPKGLYMLQLLNDLQIEKQLFLKL